MPEHARKNPEHQARTTAAATASNKAEGGYAFVDNRAEAEQLASRQEMANHSPQSVAQRRQQEQLQGSQSPEILAAPGGSQGEAATSDNPSEAANPPTQRMIARSDQQVVYSQEARDQRFKDTLNVLLGGNYNVEHRNWNAVKGIVWPNGTDGAPLEAVHNKYQHPRNVYVYPDPYSLQNDVGDTTRPLLLPDDMSEAGDQLPAVLAPASACVIQALVDFGVAAPGGAASDAAWHAWSIQRHLDYRTDSDIVRIYVGQLGYRLVNNKTVALSAVNAPNGVNAVNWNDLGGDGNYLVASYVGMPGGVGHMIGLVINNGAIQTIHDRQNLTAPTLNQNPGGVTARYIYRM